MSAVTRRTFTQAVAGVALAPALIRARQAMPPLPLAFSTLGCPAWDWRTILETARQYGYAALELRGLRDEMDLTKAPPFVGTRVKDTVADLAALHLRISDLGASATIGEEEPVKRAAQLDEARRFIDLAQALQSPYVRVFGGALKPGQTMASAIERIIAGFQALDAHAKGSGVTVLIESHDEFTTSESLLAILRGANSSAAQLLWDAHHTVVTGKETPAATFAALKPYVRHTHLKDSRPARTGETARRYVLTGEGDVPVKETVAVLVQGGYRGYYCFEWEKRWHAEIEDPEIAIPHFARVMRGYLQAATA